MLVIIAIIMILTDQCAGGAIVCFHPDCYMSLFLSFLLLEHFPFSSLKQKRVRCAEDSFDIEASSTFCLLNFLTYSSSLNTVIYMHQALDGTPLAAGRSFIPTVQVPPAPFKIKKSHNPH